jgi:hypothetical protein
MWLECVKHGKEILDFREGDSFAYRVPAASYSGAVSKNEDLGVMKRDIHVIE